MPEVLRYTKIFLEDLDIGDGYREVRLQDGRVVLLQQVSLGLLMPFSRFELTASNGAAVLTATGILGAGRRIMGVTVRILTTFGTSNGLQSLGIGDTTAPTRWGSTIGLIAGFESDMSFFESGDMPIYTTDTDLMVTAIGGLFDAVGQIELGVHYFTMAHR